MPSVRQCALLGLRLGSNGKGLSTRVAARWVLRRRQVFAAWLEAGCNGAAAARRLKVSKQCFYRTLDRYHITAHPERARDPSRVVERSAGCESGRQHHAAHALRPERIWLTAAS